MYLSAELHQQLGSVGTVGGQAAHCCAEVSQAGDGFAGLGGPSRPFSVTRAGCRTGGKTCSARRRQAHQSDQSPDVGQTERLQTCCQAAARTAEWVEENVKKRRRQVFKCITVRKLCFHHNVWFFNDKQTKTRDPNIWILKKRRGSNKHHLGKHSQRNVRLNRNTLFIIQSETSFPL